MTRNPKTNGRTPKNGKRPSVSPGRQSLLMFAALAAAITLLIYPGLVVTAPVYTLGEVADKNIKSPRDFVVEDPDATEARQREAALSVLTVYDFDAALSVKTADRINQAFADMRKAADDYDSARDAQRNQDAALSQESGAASLEQALWQKKPEFEKALGVPVSDAAYKLFIRERFDERIPREIGQIIKTILANGVVGNKDILMKEADRGIRLRGVGTETEESVQSLRRFYSLDQARTMVRVVGDPVLKGTGRALLNVIVDLAQRLIVPNITVNRHETENRRTDAASRVRPVLFPVKAGEMLLREGEVVTDRHLLKLVALQGAVNEKRVLERSLGAGILSLVFFVAFYFISFRRARHPNADIRKDTALICAVLLTFFLAAKGSMALATKMSPETAYGTFPTAWFFGAPLAAGAMILCVFLGLEMALPFAVMLTFCVSAVFITPFETWAYFFVNSGLGAYWVRNCRERNVYLKTGFKVGLLNIGLVVALWLHSGQPIEEAFLLDISVGFLGGVAAGILTAGIVPLAEAAFGYTTDSKLLELANLDRPLMRRLMIEAPGTYHHSMVVGSMVEAAASEIGANPLLAKVCGYYHDIGKINKPLYFIENQIGCKNRHDKLAPSMSSLIITAHVKDGVELAKKHGLGARITDTIQQHHGTSLISFFYDKARKLKGQDAVSEDDYRYPGPRPQTKEAGLVMLADVVEAASRTLDNPTPARIQGMVQQLISKIFSDGELDECELTLKDLHQIAKSFNQILNGIFHHRIEYAQGPTKGEEKGRKQGAGPDLKPAEASQDTNGQDTEPSPSHLRRLGLS